jgi:hypothetical protein
MRVIFRMAVSVWMLFAGGLLAMRPPASQPAATGADRPSAEDALRAYEATKPAMLKLDYPALARTLADNRRPVLPKDRQTDVAIDGVVQRLRKEDVDLEKTRQLLADVEKLKPRTGAATFERAKVRDFDVWLVKIPLPGTQELAQKHGLGKGDKTTDGDGNLAVLIPADGGVGST